MSRKFEVIDLMSGNVIGEHESEDAALAALLRFLQDHGSRTIAEFSLMRITDEDQFLVAMHDNLERLVRDSETGVAPSSL